MRLPATLCNSRSNLQRLAKCEQPYRLFTRSIPAGVVGRGATIKCLRNRRRVPPHPAGPRYNTAGTTPFTLQKVRLELGVYSNGRNPLGRWGRFVPLSWRLSCKLPSDDNDATFLSKF